MGKEFIIVTKTPIQSKIGWEVGTRREVENRGWLVTQSSPARTSHGQADPPYNPSQPPSHPIPYSANSSPRCLSPSAHQWPTLPPSFPLTSHTFTLLGRPNHNHHHHQHCHLPNHLLHHHHHRYHDCIQSTHHTNQAHFHLHWVVWLLVSSSILSEARYHREPAHTRGQSVHFLKGPESSS